MGVFLLVLLLVASVTILTGRGAEVERALNRWLGAIGYSGYHSQYQCADILITTSGHIKDAVFDSLTIRDVNATTINKLDGFLTVLDSVVYSDSTMTFYNADGKTSTLSFTTP